MLTLDYHHYDSFFLETSFQFSIPFKIDDFQSNQWPSCIKPFELANSFKQLEGFILNQANWSFSDCTNDELQTIETSLSKLLALLQVQKQYANKYWKDSPQRIQASAIHLYIFLQMLVKAIIPYPTMSLFECRAARKMCINLKSLQNAMNIFLKNAKPIYEFLQSDIFSEQVHLTHNFLQNWVHFMKNLPSLKRNKMNHVPNLQKFVILKNKAAQESFSDELEKKLVSQEQSSASRRQINFNFLRSQSFQNSLRKNSQFQFPQQKLKAKSIQFKFPPHITSSIRMKNKTAYQFKTSESLSHIESPILKKNITHYSKTTRDSPSPKRRVTFVEEKNTITPKIQKKQSTIGSNRGRKKSYVVPQEPDEQRSVIRDARKQNSEFRSPTKIQNRQGNVIKIDLEEEAKKTFQNERYKIPNIDTSSGARVSRGWQFIRDYVRKRIARRKLQKLIGISFELSNDLTTVDF